MAETDYGAITIDTNIFDRYQIALEKGPLNQLDQFKTGPVRVVISEIIHNEIYAHLKKNIESSQSQIKRAIRNARAQLQTKETALSEAHKLLLGGDENRDIAFERMAAFYIKLNVEIISVGKSFDISNLVKMYFESSAPFENNEKKKYEFPDAIALLSLEKWAEDNDVKILAVSSDKGWEKYGVSSQRIDVVDDLSVAFIHFADHISAASIIERIRTDYQSDPENNIFDSITGGIEESLDGACICVDADSSYYYEEEDAVAEYGSHELECDENEKPIINAIRVEDDLLVLQMTAIVTCDAFASFSLSVWDSEDKEYMNIGSSSKCIQHDYSTKILVYLVGEIKNGIDSLEVEKVEVLEYPDHIHFGEIEPDWYDDPH